MVRKKQAPVINVKMYRNFAVATVLLTGAIALLADGDKREAIASEVENIEVPKLKPQAPTLIIRNDRVSEGGDLSGFYTDTSSDTSASAGTDSSYIGDVLTVDNMDSARGAKQLARAGLSIEQFNALSDAEKRTLLAMLNGGTSAEERAKAAKGAAVASLARSGGGEGSDY